MKRVLAWVLVLILCLGMFAGCKKKDNETPNSGEVVTSTADLEAALEYIKTVYKKPSEKTPKDFQRIGVVPVNGKKYEVVWTADVGEEYIKIVKGTDGMVTIDVNENVEAEVKYVLTATISDDAGNSVSHSWNHLIPTAGNMVSIVEDAYKLQPGEAMDYTVTLTGKITSIDTPWSADYKNITVTIVVEGAEDKPIQCYRLKGDGADKLKPNDIITVTGTLKNYNGTIEFDAGCTLDAVIEGEEVKAPEDPKQIIKEAYELAQGGALPYKATLTGVISKVNTEYNPGYKNVTVTIVVDGDKAHPIQCYRLAGNGAEKIGEGDTITVTGWIVNYKGTVQFGQGCTLDSWKDTGANVPKPEDTFTTTLVPEIVTEPKAGVAYKFFMEQKNYGKNFYLTGNMDGYYYETTYDPAKAVDVYLEEVSGGWRAYFMKDGAKNYLEMAVSGTHKNVIFTTNPTKALKWNSEINTITCDLIFEGQNKDYYWGTYSFYKTFSASDVARVTGADADLEANFVAHFATMKETAVKEKSAAEKAFEALKEEYFVASSEATATAEDYTRKNVYDIDGTKVPVVWTENSDAVEIVDNGDGTVTVKVTRGEADAAYTLTATIADGDTKYTTSWQCVVPAAPQVPAEGNITSIPEANKIGAAQTEDYTADKYLVKGTVVEIVNAKYGNVYIADAAGNRFYIYGLYDAEGNRYDALAVPPVVGDILVVEGALGQYKGEPQMKNGTIASHTQVLSLEAANTMGEGLTADTETKYQVSGTITEIANAKYGNMYIEDAAGKKLYIYGVYSADGETRYDGMEQKPAVGDFVSLYGVMSQYKGTAQMKNGWLVEHRVSATLPQANTIGEAVANNETTPIKYQVSGTVTEIANEKYGNMYIQDAEGNKLYIYGLYDAIGHLRFDEMTVKPAVGDTVTIYGVLCQYKGAAQIKNGWLLEHTVPTVEPNPDVPANTTTSVTIADYAAENSWANGTQYSTITMDENVTVTATGGSNTGKYYTSGNNWRIYQSETPSVKIEAAAGNIVSVKVTYVKEKNGVLTLNGDTVESGAVVEVNAPSVTFGVGNTGTATNGQARITAIEVVYAAEIAPANTTTSVSIGDYAAENSWANGTQYSTIMMDENVTVTATGGSNTGKYYTSGNNWRIYQTETPSVKIEAAAGNIVSVKVTYVKEKNGVLTLNGDVVESGAVVEVNAPSVTFGVGNTGTATNGQARITAIEVVYSTTASGGSGSSGSGNGSGSETPAPVPTLPDVDGAEVSIADAIAVAGTMAHDSYTSKKYNVTGEIVEVYNTQYGNMRIKDAEGNILTIYGSYSADGSTRYDAMSAKPVAGDTVTIYGKIGQFNGTPQIKNGWIVDFATATPVYPGNEAITNVVYTYGNTDAYSNVIKNWGRRGYNATFLSPNAVSFYADNNVTYEELAALAGSSTVSSVPSSALYTTLQELMEFNHTKQTTYGDTRDLYRYTDCQDQVDSYGISCFYSGNKIGPAWDSGSTWNREHCWPKSKANATWNSNNSNGNSGELGDLMTLRPVVSNINSSRGNKAYGMSDGYYDPNGNTSLYNVRGDVARIVLYTYVRWEDSAHMWGEAGVIENVNVLLDWMQEDPVDTWEMGRNDSVESVTGTRNVFVDYPELAFVLFGEEVPSMVTPSGKAAA